MSQENSFGEFIKNRRIALGITLRKFCSDNDIDPGNHSKLERGRLRPPQDKEKLKEYARMLHIRDGSEDWITFFDLAAAESGRIPEEILSDSSLRNKLPILFRTLRGQKVPKEDLDELIKKIRGA